MICELDPDWIVNHRRSAAGKNLYCMWRLYKSSCRIVRRETVAATSQALHQFAWRQRVARGDWPRRRIDSSKGSKSPGRQPAIDLTGVPVIDPHQRYITKDKQSENDLPAYLNGPA